MAKDLQIRCDFCQSPVETPGGLIFTPSPDNHLTSKKHHLCIQCSAKVSSLLDLTNQRKTGGGVYYSPPLDTISWEVITRQLSEEEATDLIQGLTHPE